MKPCRRCRTPRPLDDFPLLDDPQAVAQGWATRTWCTPCLLERGHLTTAQAAKLERARVERAERVERAKRLDRLTRQLADRAQGDDLFAAALLAAATLTPAPAGFSPYGRPLGRRPKAVA